MFPKHLDEPHACFPWSLCLPDFSAVEQRRASFLNPRHGNYQLGVCLRSQATQTCHVQLLEETAQCCLRISWTPACLPCSLLPSHSHPHSLSSCCLLCSHRVWSGATRRLARLKGSGRRADVQIVLIPSTKVFLNSGSPSETMNNAGFVCDTPEPLSTASSLALKAATVPPLGPPMNCTSGQSWRMKQKWAGNLSGVE